MKKDKYESNINPDILAHNLAYQYYNNKDEYKRIVNSIETLVQNEILESKYLYFLNTFERLAGEV